MVTLKLMKIVRLPVPAFMLPATAALKGAPADDGCR